MVKNLPAMPETQVQSLALEDPLEKGMVAHSNILAQRILYTEEPGGLPSIILKHQIMSTIGGPVQGTSQGLH